MQVNGIEQNWSIVDYHFIAQWWLCVSGQGVQIGMDL